MSDTCTHCGGSGTVVIDEQDPDGNWITRLVPCGFCGGTGER